jgi:amidohydrolase
MSVSSVPPVRHSNHSLAPVFVSKASSLVDSDNARLQTIFKDIHQHPELGFSEKRTAGIVAQQLKDLEFEVTTGIGKTGVVGVLRNGSGPIVMYRADMDANAVEEITGLPYASKVRVKREDGEVPVGHMCGHDAHITWMLGMAKAMVKMKSDWSGTLVLVAQPAEELASGAKAMVADGLYTTHKIPVPNYFFAMHAAPGPLGFIANVSGVRMAGADLVDVLFKGIGGHGSLPQVSKDPVIMAATAVVGYQVLVSRMIDPLEMAVLTVGSIQAGTDGNIIPAQALVKINLRWFHPAVREKLINGIKAISNSIASAYAMSDDTMPAITVKGGTTPLTNDAELVARLNIAFRSLLGDKNVVEEFPPATGSEDCHLLMGDHKIPFDFVLVGVADPQVFAEARRQGKFLPYANHDGNFKVELPAIPLGAKIGTVAMLDLLAH